VAARGLLYFSSVLWWFRTPAYPVNALNMALSSLGTGGEIAGVFRRVFRIPGTLAFPGCSR
jgi:hypothetical protein